MASKSKLSCEPRTAVAYARYSSAVQRDVSIEQQLRDIRSFAQREGYTIIREYCDHAKSGFRHTDKRTEFQRMLLDAEKGNFDTVLAWKVDRFGRSREDSAIYKGKLRRHGVTVVYAMEPIPDGAAGVLLEGMLEATAEWYSRNLSENVTRGMRDNASRCMYNGTRILGYRRGSDGHYEIDPNEAPVVREIFDQYSSGQSASHIALDLQARGLRTPRGAQWSPQTVLRVLANERYCGVYIWGDFRTEGGMPSIIDRIKWEGVQQQMKNSRRVIHQDSSADFFLTGKLFCGHCGAAMVGDSGTSKTGARHFYYCCLNHKNRRTCGKRSVQKALVEDAVVDYVLDVVLTDSVIDQMVDAVLEEEKKRKASSPLPGMESEYAETLRKIKNINMAIAQGVWSSSTVATLKDLEAQAEDLKYSIVVQRSAESTFTDPELLRYYFHRFTGRSRDDPSFRSLLVSTFVNSIYVYDDHLRLFINTVEGAYRIRFEDLPPDPGPGESSDDLAHGVLFMKRPNSFEFRIAI